MPKHQHRPCLSQLEPSPETPTRKNPPGTLACPQAAVRWGPSQLRTSIMHRNLPHEAAQRRTEIRYHPTAGHLTEQVNQRAISTHCEPIKQHHATKPQRSESLGLFQQHFVGQTPLWRCQSQNFNKLQVFSRTWTHCIRPDSLVMLKPSEKDLRAATEAHKISRKVFEAGFHEAQWTQRRLQQPGKRISQKMKRILPPLFRRLYVRRVQLQNVLYDTVHTYTHTLNAHFSS